MNHEQFSSCFLLLGLTLCLSSILVPDFSLFIAGLFASAIGLAFMIIVVSIGLDDLPCETEQRHAELNPDVRGRGGVAPNRL